MARLSTRDGCTPNELIFARLLVFGETQIEAFRKAFRLRDTVGKDVADRAYRLANSARVSAAKQTILTELRQEDLDSVGATLLDLLRYMKLAEDDKNWTALAAFTRLRMAAKGMLSETVVVRAEQSLSDETLVKQLAGKDQAKADVLISLLGMKKKAA